MKPIPHKERAMLYHLPAASEKGGKVRRVLHDLGITIIEITDDLFGQTVGYCAGISGYSRNASPCTGNGIDDDVMIMVALSDEKINQLLAQLRKVATGPIGLMAVVTEHNRSWTLTQLFTELNRERLVMTAYVSLQQTLKAAEAISRAGLDEASDPEMASRLEQGIAAAKTLIQSEEPPDPEALRKADELLKGLLKE